MRIDFLRLALLGFATASLVSACADEPAPSSSSTESLTDDGARIVRAASGTLTGVSSAAAATIVGDFVRGRVGGAADQLHVVGATSTRGVTHVRFEQHVDGLRVHGAYVKAAISARGELLQVIEKVAPAGGTISKAAVTERDALTAAFGQHGYELGVPAQTAVTGKLTRFARGDVFHREPSVERVAYLEKGTLREGFLVETWSLQGNQLDHTLVDGHGKIIATERRTNNDSYRVFVEDPGKGGQTVVSGGATPESPSGWLGTGTQSTINITGNNSHAYLDAVSNNAPDAGGTAVTDGNFLATADLAQSPSTVANQAVAVQNLFYLNNFAHDALYRHGFDEAAGNFQSNNFGLGGAGNDAVNAEAQDGGGLDNANFATPTDGSAPRMQMYLWSGTTSSGVVTVGSTDRGLYASSFGAALTATGVTGALASVNDGVGTTSDGCESSPAGSLTGKVAIVDRGACDFTVKVLNAQNAGAIAVVIANNVTSNPFGPGGTNRKVKIASGMVSQADGAALRALGAVSARVRTNPTPALRLDGDLDSDIVFHEYGHGLTWRMIGSMSGPMSGAIGEGASDTVAFLLNGDDRIGEYSFADPLGIRRQAYASYVGSYKDVTGGEVHNDGELYAAAMYQVLENYLAAGLSSTDALDDFVDGMNFTPAAPAMEDMRDGMLAAAPTDRACLIWSGFAQYGMGVGADGRVAMSKGKQVVVVTESFAKPAGCP